jgi:hypothetical protein
MKKLFFILFLVSNSLGIFAQNDSISNNAVKETNKIDALSQLSESQKKEILKILQDYYTHKEIIVKTRDVIETAKANLKDMLEMVTEEERSFDEKLTYILTKHQYEKCAPYLLERKGKINNTNEITKKAVKPKEIKKY